MADNNGTDLNFFKVHIKEECGLANIKVEEVDEEIMTEPELVGGPWVYQNADEPLENENRNLEYSATRLLNENPVCRLCKMKYTDYCINCGHLSHILNNEVEIGHYERAMDSIPKHILEIKGSLTDGYHVYALRNIPKGVKFGPYEGLETLNTGNKYLWKIRHSKLVEVKSENYCNWMKYIDYTTTQSAQNLTALQFMGKLYYKSLREIKIGEELLINYINNSSDYLGLHGTQYFQPEVEEINENIYKCPPCHFGFSEEKYLITHNKVCPYKKKIVTEVKGSSGIEACEDDSKICEQIHILRTPRMADNNGTDFNLLKFHIKEECSLANIKVEEVDQEIINSGAEVLRRSEIHQAININKPLQNENSAEQLNENDDNDSLSTGTLKKIVLVSQKECDKNVPLNHAKGTKQNSEHFDYNVTERKYKCNECSYSAVLKKNLLSHIQFRHTVEKAYKCSECSYASVRKQHLFRHIKSRHTMEKPYKCNECPFGTTRKQHLLRHINSCHTIEEPYKSNECSYTTVQKQHLRHIKFSHHTLEKLHKCDECSYATLRKHHLLRHIKSRHTMEKPSKCNECSYSTLRKQHLLCHIQSCHTMEKPHKCNECSYATVRKQHLLRHIQSRHTMEKPYKCSECPYAAVRKQYLLCHIQSHHTHISFVEGVVK